MLWDFPTWLLLRLTGPANRVVSEAVGNPDARGDFAVLAAIAQYGPSSQIELCRRLGVDRSDMVALVNHLADEGWVVRSPDPADRRRNSVSLTRSGGTRLRHLQQRIESAQREFLVPLPEAGRAAFVECLQALVTHHRGGR